MKLLHFYTAFLVSISNEKKIMYRIFPKSNRQMGTNVLSYKVRYLTVLCFHEVNGMDEMELEQQIQEEGYVPRPKWQVWAARIALVVFILGLIMYYCNIFGAVR